MEFANVKFVQSAYKQSQLPPLEFPEIAFAGRSNVGKSSLINRLVNRKSVVKVSAKPGKTQSLNFFLVDDKLYLVDLPGYGYAKVPKSVKDEWQEQISIYLETRQTLRCVVVIIDLRHPLKSQDRELVDWLASKNIPYLPVYTKQDKLPLGQRQRHAAALDAALSLTQEQRVLFSAKTGDGRENLIAKLAQFV